MIYKLRAEAAYDVAKLLRELWDAMPYTETISIQMTGLEVVLDLKTLNIEELRDIMYKVEDGHCMLETVQPIEKYTGKRSIGVLLERLPALPFPKIESAEDSD